MGPARDLPAGAVTLVFTDIEGSTRLLHDLGHEYPQVLADHRVLVRESFASEGGVEVDTQGDAFFFAFAEANRALAAVARAQRSLATHPWPHGRELRVRMGVHTGEPLRTEEGYVGLALHQGARVTASAHGGQVVVSAAAAAAADAPDGLQLRDLGEHRLKDLSEPQRLFQLCGEGLREDFPPLESLGGYFTNLPTEPSPLLGRERELAELVQLLARHRLVTLTGPGGTGKTRLALQVGADLLDRFPGGVFFCDLAPLRDPALVAATIAHAIGVREQPGEASEQTVAAFAREKALLLVLDNFEQLLDATPIVARLLAACPKLRALATSRAPLRIAGECECRVESLSLQDAVALFQQRASLISGPMQSHATARSTVESICNQVDCLPLTIELAAARLRSLTPEDLLARLEQRMEVLTRGPRDAPNRQRTLRATLDWSYDLLASAEQQVLARLGVFIGGFGLDAAEQVASAHFDELDVLVEQSLLRHRDGRYTMLETVREYALGQLEHQGELDAMRIRHADWALGLLALADPRDDQVFPPGIVYGLASSEIANLRQAVPLLVERRPYDIGSHVLAVGMTWEFANLWREGAVLVQAIRAAQPHPAPSAAARSAAILARLSVLVGDLDASSESADQGILTAEIAKDDWALTIALATRSYVACHLHEPSPERYAKRALVVARQHQQPFAITLSLLTLGYAQARSHPDQARRSYEEALELARQNGNGIAEAIAAYNLGEIDLQEQRFDDAEAHLIRLLRTGVGDSVTRAFGTRGLGIALAGRRSPFVAARLIGAGDVEIERAGAFQDAREMAQRTAALERIGAVIGAEAMHDAVLAGGEMQIGDAAKLAVSLFPAGHPSP